MVASASGREAGEDSVGAASDARVAEVLATLRAGARQRLSALAGVAATDDERLLRLADLRARETVHEPLCVSPRPLVGPLLVLVRKLGFKLFAKWHALPMLEQQNAFNASAGRLIQDQAEEIHELRRRVARLQAQLEALAHPGSEPQERQG